MLVLDGRGERATTSYSVGRGNRLKRLGQVNMPHSVGLLYEQVTSYLGFLHSSDEYKVMALASFGQPRHLAEFWEIIQVADDGQYTIKDLCLEERFGHPRQRGGPVTALHLDLARSLQLALEETVLQLTSSLHRQTGMEALCLAGVSP